jgi:hypothetical protein
MSAVKLDDVRRRIGGVLLKSWDPLDVAGRPDREDARAAYVEAVVALVAAGATDREVADHLCAVETRALGYQDTDSGMLRPTAKKLRLLYRRLTSASPAG